jgi:hypothetical protein
MARRGVKPAQEDPAASGRKAMALCSSCFSPHHGTMGPGRCRWHCWQHLEGSHLSWRIGDHHRAYVRAQRGQMADQSQVKGL